MKANNIDIWGYGSVYNPGHPATQELFEGEVVITEKVDGSRVSWRVDEDGNIGIKSKNAYRDLDNPQDLFEPAVTYVKNNVHKFQPGWIYRGEVIKGTGHNVLQYEREPKNGVVLFDVERGRQDFLPPYELEEEANRIDLEHAPVLYQGEADGWNWVKDQGWHKEESFLGGVEREGFVIKNYNRFDPSTKKILKGKIVRDDFKEKLDKKWSKNKKGVVQRIAETYGTDARFQKAVQTLREDGHINNEMSDLEHLFPQVQQDIKEEAKEEIKELLWDEYWGDIKRRATAPLPEWYKERLMDIADGG